MTVTVKYNGTPEKKEQNIIFKPRNLVLLMIIVWKARKSADSVSIYFI